jgi:hypothetical protein
MLHLPFCFPLPSSGRASLSHQNETGGRKNEIEDKQLRPLAVGIADVTLKHGVRQRQHKRKNQDREHPPESHL